MFRTLCRMACFGVLGVLLLPLALTAQTPDQAAPEGYDPMIQITHQFAKPVVYVFVDLGKAMAMNEDAINPSANQGRGQNPTLEWAFSADPASQVGSGKNATWYRWWATLKITQERPGHLQIIKNVLGRGVWLFKNWTPPATWPAISAYAGASVSGPAYFRDHPNSADNYTWTYTFASPGVASFPTAGYVPFTAYDGSNAPTIGSTGNHETLAPLGLVQSTAKLVDWGFLDFSQQVSNKCGPTDGQTKCDYPADTTDSGYIDPSLTSFLDCTSASCGGWNLGGNDNIKPALEFAGMALRDTFTGGTLDTHCTMAKDSKPAACSRAYATLLFTAGQSNVCNTPDGYWSSNCSGTCPGPNCCPGSTNQIKESGVDCGIASWAGFPPYSADLNWNNPASGQQPLRTFVIGASNLVSACELNIIAYMGRTDASDPTGNGGFKLDSTGHPVDTRLPQSAGDTTHYVNDSTKPYAYLAQGSAAIKDAFLSVVAAVAAGDYTTSAPVASSALSTASVTTTAAVITTAEFPGWKGHAWSYNLSKPTTDPDYIMWDAGWNLAHDKLPADKTASPWVAGTTDNPAYVAPGSRKIYTWDPSNGNALVPIATDATTVAKLNTIAGLAANTITPATVDFLMGNNGSGTIRSWVLGSIVNSAPAVTQTPESFLQGTLENHKSFEDQSQSPGNRTPLVWVGADDDMLHAFQLSDGKEILAIIPPNLLKNQVALYANYLADPVKQSTGQPTGPQDHIYGFSGSVRYGDMYDTAIPGYRTVMLLTEGPGGKGIAGIDATDPVANLSAGNDPVKVLWYKRGGTDWSNLHTTWSTPAGGPVSPSNTPSTHSKWRSLVGSGFNFASTALATTACPTPPCQQTPYAMAFDPITGDLKKGDLVPPTPTVSSPAPWVGNQAFADSVLYQMSASAYYADNIVDLGVQADLNGQIWFLPVSGTGDITSCSVGINATAKAGQQQPIYYAPAVNGYTSGGSSYDLYVFGSGSLYEKSPRVTGPNVGTTGYFLPSLYLVAKPQTTNAASTTQIAQIPINLLYKPDDLTNTSTDPANPSYCSLAAHQVTCSPYFQVLCDSTSCAAHAKLGPRTQLTAPPALFVPVNNASANPIVLFLLYDPDDPISCAGISYVVKIAFGIDAGTGSPTVKQSQLYNAGEGAASGFAIAGSSVIVAKSAVGEGKRASFNAVPGVNPTSGMSTPVPLWWREVK